MLNLSTKIKKLKKISILFLVKCNVSNGKDSLDEEIGTKIMTKEEIQKLINENNYKKTNTIYLDRNYNSKDEDYSNKIAELDKKITELEQNKNQFSNLNQGNSSTNFENEKKELDKKITELDKKIQEIEKNKNEFLNLNQGNSSTNFQNEKKELDKKIAELDKKIQENNTNQINLYSNNDKEFKNLHDEITSLLENISRLEKSNTNLEERYRKSEEKNTLNISGINDEIKKISEDKTKKEKEINEKFENLEKAEKIKNHLDNFIEYDLEIKHKNKKNLKSITFKLKILLEKKSKKNDFENLKNELYPNLVYSNNKITIKEKDAKINFESTAGNYTISELNKFRICLNNLLKTNLNSNKELETLIIEKEIEIN